MLYKSFFFVPTTTLMLKVTIVVSYLRLINQSTAFLHIRLFFGKLSKNSNFVKYGKVWQIYIYITNTKKQGKVYCNMDSSESFNNIRLLWKQKKISENL